MLKIGLHIFSGITVLTNPGLEDTAKNVPQTVLFHLYKGKEVEVSQQTG